MSDEVVESAIDAVHAAEGVEAVEAIQAVDEDFAETARRFAELRQRLSEPASAANRVAEEPAEAPRRRGVVAMLEHALGRS